MFGEIVNDEMVLNEFGNIAYQQWHKLPERFTNMELDVFQVMPNHIHGIIALNDNDPKTKTVGDIVGHTNRWLPMIAWIFIKSKMNGWENYGNSIIWKTSFVMSKLIGTFPNTL